MTERKIGEKFKHKGKIFEVIESKKCTQCEFSYDHISCAAFVCFNIDRSDGKMVIVKEANDKI